MGQNPVPLLTAQSAVDLCKFYQIKIKPAGQALLEASQTPREYFELLSASGHYADARRVLAHALPKRRALWWGCLCAWDVYGPEPPEIVSAVLQAVGGYVLDPREQLRRAAASLGKKARPNTLAGCLAMAAFFSGGSVSLPGLPHVAPKPFVTGRLVSVCVYLAAVLRDPARYKDHLRQYLDVGRALACGDHLWPSSPRLELVEEELAVLSC